MGLKIYKFTKFTNSNSDYLCHIQIPNKIFYLSRRFRKRQLEQLWTCQKIETRLVRNVRTDQMSWMRRVVRDLGQASHSRGQLSLLRPAEVSPSASVQRFERILFRMSKAVGIASVLHVSHGSQTQSCLCGNFILQKIKIKILLKFCFCQFGNFFNIIDRYKN